MEIEVVHGSWITNRWGRRDVGMWKKACITCRGHCGGCFGDGAVICAETSEVVVLSTLAI